MEDDLKKIKMKDDFIKKWKTISTKNWRQPQQKIEDNLKKMEMEGDLKKIFKMEDDLQKKWKTTSKKGRQPLIKPFLNKKKSKMTLKNENNIKKI
jgi:hypothetical protein